MAILHIDLRLADVEYELYTVTEHRETLERQLAMWRQEDYKRTWEKLRREKLEDDEAEVQMALQLHGHIMDHTLPRLIRGSYIVILWAVFEAAVTDIAEHLRKGTDQQLSLRDISGDSFLARAEKYFTAVLRMPLATTSTDRQHLKSFMLVRNAIAHANGRIDAVSKDNLRGLQKVIEDQVGISDDDGYVMISEEFAVTSSETVNSVLKPLIKKVYATGSSGAA